MTEAQLDIDGAVHLSGLVIDELERWHELTDRYFSLGKPGVRIVDDCALASAVSELLRQPPLLEQLGAAQWRCVRAIAFDKVPEANWALGWHQDRTIAVTEKTEFSGYGPWSLKDGIAHVEPPFSLMDTLRTLRLHLDPVDDTNGALQAARGSHRFGKVGDTEAGARAAAVPILSCRAEAGDGWLYATPILHASSRSTSPARRRVLHLEFSANDLPPPLRWRGIG
ncbi:MAG: phytanoyl-CoA dioxygenase family protein [Candidatus Andeanibacterium colombiense]|uniref:Phytanoyl-CoA dioxygenase family protein n=1 Tax=Candidatus Andeanibacterium colombiense TaxID=3121345 RepID=A0AAJ5X3U4_9SPHN|nr:MAG: phytanoyl-CoA dioxygenase family protein [Sphingomonadaceae bacterium]